MRSTSPTTLTAERGTALEVSDKGVPDKKALSVSPSSRFRPVTVSKALVQSARRHPSAAGAMPAGSTRRGLQRGPETGGIGGAILLGGRLAVTAGVVEPVVVVAGDHVNVVVPDVLATGAFVVLPCGDAVAVVAASHRDRDLLHDVVNGVSGLGGQVIEVLDVSIGDHQHRSRVVRVPVERHERARAPVTNHDVLLAIATPVLPPQQTAERATPVFRFVVEHAEHSGRRRPAVPAGRSPPATGARQCLRGTVYGRRGRRVGLWARVATASPGP